MYKANTILILFPKIRNADFAKKYAWEYSQAKRQSGISTIREQKQSWWKRKNLALSAWLLNDTRKVINDWKISQTFWRRTEYLRVPERESQKQERLTFLLIRSISDFLTTQKNCTKESTSQSFQRNFLTKHRKC
ncbi:MAG: hypothetical protein A3E92_00075 [Candidatus Taylorbacteria bacterium RIFCSPHIGHO2_12_FULL_42_34]|nr:MAG: hypothetical protein A3E92_00075 [Candidatus Taylorbacteria bacterium RIFCSPHIGHO2_12_FULL_42_34]